MFTNNFYALQKLAIICTNPRNNAIRYSKSYISSHYGITLNPMTGNSTTVDMPVYPFGTLKKRGEASNGGVFIFVGSGNTAPSLNDTDLAQRHSDSVISDLSVQTTATWANGNEVMTYTLTAKNNSANTITISEVGLGVNDPYDGYSTTFSTNVICMIWRDVLTQIIEVPANSSFAVSVQLAISKIS